MADGPTVPQIIKKRDSDVAACEATARQERTSREAVKLSLLESVKDFALYGPGGKLSVDVLKIQGDEHLCKFNARLQADEALVRRETALDIAKLNAESKALINGELAERYRQELIESRRPKPEPDLGHPRGKQILLAKK